MKGQWCYLISKTCEETYCNDCYAFLEETNACMEIVKKMPKCLNCGREIDSLDVFSYRAFIDAKVSLATDDAAFIEYTAKSFTVDPDTITGREFCCPVCGVKILDSEDAAFAFLSDGGNEEHNHINGNTLDNTTQNLEWLTSSDNHKHAIKTGLAKPPPTKNPLNSGRKYWWQHEDGTYLLKTCSEMGRFVNASNAPFFKMVSGKPQNHRSFRGWALAKIYPPGSKEAMENLCACAIIDNHCGAGIDGKGKQFWINEACPLHANKN